jgi:hypothetical protein
VGIVARVAELLVVFETEEGTGVHEVGEALAAEPREEIVVRFGETRRTVARHRVDDAPVLGRGDVTQIAASTGEEQAGTG